MSASKLQPHQQHIVQEQLAQLEEEYAQPLIDFKYIQNLQRKRKAVEDRLLLRKQEVKQQQEMHQAKIEKTIEFLVKEKTNFEKRNSAFLNDMRKNLEKFHRELSKVYAAEESLIETRSVYLNFVKRNNPKLMNVLELKNRETRQQLVERLGPRVGTEFDEILRIQNENQKLKDQIQLEEMKQQYNKFFGGTDAQQPVDGTHGSASAMVRPNQSFSEQESQLDQFMKRPETAYFKPTN